MRHMLSTLIAALAVTGGLPIGAAAAAVVTFSGTQSYVNVLNPPNSGRCAPQYFTTVNIAPGALSSSGTSNFGDFAATQSHCVVTTPPSEIVDGIFSFAFSAGDVLTGIYTGQQNFSQNPDRDFDQVTYLLVTGGTGRFLNAGGTLTLVGDLIRYANPVGPGFVADFSGSLSGVLDLPGVPEPRTWAMMLLGFGATGWVVRRRRRAPMARRRFPAALHA